MDKGRPTFLRQEPYRRFFYAYYDRQYYEFNGTGHDGNPTHRVTPVRREETPELARGMGRAVKEFSTARDEIERELSQSRAGKTTQPKLLGATSELPTPE